jgi:hypothetical protein
MDKKLYVMTHCEVSLDVEIYGPFHNSPQAHEFGEHFGNNISSFLVTKLTTEQAEALNAVDPNKSYVVRISDKQRRCLILALQHWEVTNEVADDLSFNLKNMAGSTLHLNDFVD